MTVLIKAAAVGITGAILCLLLKKSAPELGLAVSIAVSLLAASLGVSLLEEVIELLKILQEEADLSAALVSPVLKCVGIGVVTRLSVDLCKDAGQGAAASAVELCGTACALTAALPLVRTLLQMIGEML